MPATTINLKKLNYPEKAYILIQPKIQSVYHTGIESKKKQKINKIWRSFSWVKLQ